MAASISALSALESLPGTTTQLQSKPRRMRDRSDKARVYSEKQARRGARRHNRWLNLLEIFELDEEPDWNYVETKNLTSFDKLLENASLTEQWINSAPAEFASVEDNFCCRPSYSEVKISFRQAEILTPSQRFNRMDRHIRKAYSRSNVPLEIIDTFEKELFCNFSSDPDMVLRNEKWSAPCDY
eukprot:CFRG0556T1